jgi:hypothetical protein
MHLDSLPPKVFISYSHDSQEHKDRVLELSERLREDGIDCNIDQYEESPLEGWQRWMLNQIEAADHVLVVCTERYNRRFRGLEASGKGKGGTWEGHLILQNIYDDHRKTSKFIPVILTAEDYKFIPTPLRSTTFYELMTPNGYESIYRCLTHQPRSPKPEVGKLRTFPTHDRKQTFQPSVRGRSERSILSQDSQHNSINPKDRLIKILLKIPSLSTQENRDLLLQNLPPAPVSTICRSNATMIDLSNIVSATFAWGRLTSGELSLAILTRNALRLVEGTHFENELKELLNELGDTA